MKDHIRGIRVLHWLSVQGCLNPEVAWVRDHIARDQARTQGCERVKGFAETPLTGSEGGSLPLSGADIVSDGIAYVHNV